MQRHWKRYLLLLALVAVLTYGTWRAYTDYQLRSYPQQIADSIPIPQGVEKVKEETVFAGKCRSVYIYRYYATDTPWEDIAAFYNTYVQSSFWKPRGNETRYLQQLSTHESIRFSYGRIQKTSSDLDLATLAQEKTVYALQVSYLQDERLFDTVCKSED